MKPRTLDEWLLWQESLHPREIELGLDRVRNVSQRLSLKPPQGGVFSIAGTNGKGSTVAFLEGLMCAAGRKVGAYTSPHLVRYNERVRVQSRPCDDATLIEAFETVAEACGEVQLTYFEFGTLAAMLIFSQRQCDVWLLEVGLGGRLDAVNVIDPDHSIVTTVALDHQAWLGNSVEQIAREKAGIFRRSAPAYYGDRPVPRAVVARAAELGTRLFSLGTDFGFEFDGRHWHWRGEQINLTGLARSSVVDHAQLKNISVALAAIEQYDRSLLQKPAVRAALQGFAPAGRFQTLEREERQWILDVAHNPQAARDLAARIRALHERRETTIVLGMMGDKQFDAFTTELDECADRWIVCELTDSRAVSGSVLVEHIRATSDAPVELAASPEQGLDRVATLAAPGARIVVCGSFRIVGPALQWLGLY